MARLTKEKREETYKQQKKEIQENIHRHHRNTKDHARILWKTLCHKIQSPRGKG